MKLRAVPWDRVAKTEVVLRQEFREVMVQDENDAEYASVEVHSERCDGGRLQKPADVRQRCLHELSKRVPALQNISGPLCRGESLAHLVVRKLQQAGHE